MSEGQRGLTQQTGNLYKFAFVTPIPLKGGYKENLLLFYSPLIALLRGRLVQRGDVRRTEEVNPTTREPLQIRIYNPPPPERGL